MIGFFAFNRYGNTHSENSLCALQSTKFREEARNIIKKSVNANDSDVVIFTGSGSTGAIHTLVDALDLSDETARKNVVVLVSVFEHHSNLLPWKELGVEVRGKTRLMLFSIINLCNLFTIRQGRARPYYAKRYTR